MKYLEAPLLPEFRGPNLGKWGETDSASREYCHSHR
ncbi:hypothetical protein FOXYSP1_19355 [Fusarium oxysporum f. sp. phaseoli]